MDYWNYLEESISGISQIFRELMLDITLTSNVIPVSMYRKIDPDSPPPKRIPRKIFKIDPNIFERNLKEPRRY